MNQPKNKTLTIITHSKLFEALGTEQTEALSQYATLRTVSKGETLFTEGTVADEFIIIGLGQVKVVKFSANGKEQILHVLGPYEPVGEVAVFAGGAYPATCIALTDIELCSIQRDHLIGLIQAQPQIAFDLLAVLSRRLQHFSRLLESISLDESQVKLAKYIYQYCLSQPVVRDEFVLPMSKGELAKALGITAETLSRSFAKLKRDGIVQVKGRTIQIQDWDRLTRMVN